MASNSAPALRVTDLTVRYGGVQAVDQLSLCVQRGQIVGLIGPNGAGKTSALDGISGFTRAWSGRIEVEGHDVTTWSIHRRVRAGLARTFQQLELCNDLTVRENLVVSARSANRSSVEIVDRALEAFGLTTSVNRTIGTLPQGQRRLAAVARAYVANPVALLLDEPAAGLDPHETEDLRTRLLDLAASGVGVLLVEHDMAMVMQTCTEVVVIDFGVTIGTGSPDAIRDNQRVVEAYLGDVAHA